MDTRMPRNMATTSPRAESEPLLSTFLRATSASALLSFLVMIALAILTEVAFEFSVCVMDTGISTSKTQWVRLPIDRPGEGHFLLPLDLFKTTFLDQVVMPVLFALMVITASALLVQNLEVEHFFF